MTASAATARLQDHVYATGRSTWFLGLIAFGQGRIGDAQAHYDETLSTFMTLGDAEQTAGAHNLLASLHGYLGDEARAWQYRSAALPALSITRSQRLRYGLLVGAAAAIRRQDPEAALTFQDAVVESARESAREAAIIDGLSLRASLLTELGRKSEARRDLDDARTAVNRISNASMRQRTEESVLAAEGDFFLTHDPKRAVEATSLAIARVSQRNERLKVAQLSLKLAKANIVWGHLVAAEAALANGIAAFEEERSSLSDEGRVSTLDESWRLFDAAVQLAIKKGTTRARSRCRSSARARTLAERNQSTAGHSLADIQPLWSRTEAIVALNQFDNELAVWVIGRAGTTVVMRPLPRRDCAAIRRTSAGRNPSGSERPACERGTLQRNPAARVRGTWPEHHGCRSSRCALTLSASFAALWDASQTTIPG